MAILKQCTNMTLKVNSTYSLQVENKLEKKADKVNIEAMHNNLILACNKKIVGRGGKA
ncbi:hypothetical protein [Pedobacter miscanthi]|jgi:hypothetical protein|uniref:hypothetical protein n=1 Tax=Pedobacter miscanthi TaxID=2259170 RepID=UPI001313E675|nr:hypothetical protein [Pedobacter miscanthi]